MTPPSQTVTEINKINKWSYPFLKSDGYLQPQTEVMIDYLNELIEAVNTLQREEHRRGK